MNKLELLFHHRRQYIMDPLTPSKKNNSCLSEGVVTSITHKKALCFL